MTSAAVGFVSQSKHNAAGFELDFEVLVQEDCVNDSTGVFINSVTTV